MARKIYVRLPMDLKDLKLHLKISLTLKLNNPTLLINQNHSHPKTTDKTPKQSTPRPHHTRNKTSHNNSTTIYRK